MPVTATVIKTVEALAKADGMKGLKIRSRTGEILYDSAWIAGVDYEEDAADEDYDPEEDQSDGSSEDEDSNDTDSMLVALMRHSKLRSSLQCMTSLK